MKKSIKINLGGLVLHVDEDAYELLRNYLDQIQLRFTQVPGESEILNDIETRMAELFQEKLVPGKEVIGLADAREVIGVMGQPEEIGDTGEEDMGPSMPPPIRGRGRRMYRDPGNQRIAGVCSGLAAYFRVDPLLIRILFVVFTLAYGAGILIYFALWVGVPQARTAAEKLEMFGEEVNVFNIERQVRQEYPYDPMDPGNLQPARRSSQETLISRMIRALGQVIALFIKGIGLIIAFSFIIAGIAILGAIIGLAVSGKAWFINSDWNLNGIDWSEAISFFVSPTTATIGVIALILLVAIPLVGLIYGVVKVIFRFKSSNRFGALSLSGLWVITLIVLIVLGISEGVKYANQGETRVEKELALLPGKKLIVKSFSAPGESYDFRREFNNHDDFWISRENDSINLMVRPSIRIEYSEDSVAGIVIRKMARGESYRIARENADEIRYSYTLQDSVLVLDPAYKLMKSDRFHAQEVRVTIDLPKGTVVYLDKSLEHMLYDIQNTDDIWSGEMIGEEWVMTPEGLTRVLKNEIKKN